MSEFVTNAELRIEAERLVEENEELRAENAKLRERYYAYEYKMDGLVSSLTGGLLSKSAATPNDVLYSSVVDELTEDQIKENCKLEADNAKLRELARRFGEYVSQDRCEGCVMKRRCNNGDVEECWQMTEIRALANELEIEVE